MSKPLTRLKVYGVHKDITGDYSKIFGDVTEVWKDEKLKLFRDLNIYGIGFTETYLDYEINQDGEICINRIDPLEILRKNGRKKRKT